MEGNATAGAEAAAVLWRSIALGALAIGLALSVWALRRPGRPADADTMPMLAHVEELRRRILWGLATWITASMAAFTVRIDTVQGIPVPVPSSKDNLAAQVFRALHDHVVPADVTLIVLRPIDGFLAEFGVALAVGFVISLPLLLYHAGRFLGPAMREQEKQALRRAFVPALALFALGVWFCWAFVLPFVLETLYGYGSALGAELFLSVPDLIQFSVTFLLIFGISFQTPLVMYALTRAGLTTSGTYTRYWRHAVVAILIFSAMVTDPTIVSQLLVAGPLVLLYGVGVLAAKVGARRSAS